jgi:MFS family permease
MKTSIFGRLFARSSPGPDASPPVFLAFRSSTIFISTVVSFAIFTDIFAYGFIAPVLPFALESRLGIAPDQLQSWTSILLCLYGAALITGAPIAGWIADHTVSRQMPLLGGLAALLVSTVLLCVSRSVALFAVGRFLSGVSSAVIWTVGLALLGDTVGSANIGIAMGYVSVAMSLGILVAPLLGGVVYAKGGYISVFAMAFGLIAVDIFLRFAMIEKRVAARYDPPQVETSVELQKQGDEETAAAEPSEEARNELTQTQSAITQRIKKFLPPFVTLLTSKRMWAMLWAALVQAALLSAFDAVLPLRAAELFGYSSAGAGLLFLAIAIPSFVSPISGWLSDKHGARYLTAAGFALACPVYVLLRFVDHNSLSQKVLLCALLALCGLALALVLPPVMAEVSHIVEAHERSRPGVFGARGAFAQGYALLNMAYAAGVLIGPIWAGFVREKAGWGTMGWTLGLLSAITVVPVICFVGGTLWEKKEEE